MAPDRRMRPACGTSREGLGMSAAAPGIGPDARKGPLRTEWAPRRSRRLQRRLQSFATTRSRPQEVRSYPSAR